MEIGVLGFSGEMETLKRDQYQGGKAPISKMPPNKVHNSCPTRALKNVDKALSSMASCLV